MSPEILRHRLSLLQQVLIDMGPHVAASRKKQEKAHYEIERQVQLAVDLSASVGHRLLSLLSRPIPETPREIFAALQKAQVISKALATRLSQNVGLRNILVHEYGEIDYRLFFGGLKGGYKSFVSFAERVTTFIENRVSRQNLNRIKTP